MRSLSKRMSSLLALSLLAVGVYACDNAPPAQPEAQKQEPVTAPTPSATEAPKPPQPEARRPRKRGGRGEGVVGRLFHAALALELKDEQKTAIEKSLDELSPDETKPGADARKTAMEALNKEISAGVKAGKIEEAKLEPLFAEVDKAHKARQEAEAKALNELYAKLDATQRKSVVDSIRADQKKRAERMEKMKEERKGDDDKAKADKPDWSKRRMERLTRDLELDDAQKKQVETLLAKQKPIDPKASREAQQKRMEAVLAAFEKDGFDATKLDLSTTPPMKEHQKVMLAELNGLLGIIKPEQREKLALSVERQHRMGGGRGMPGGPGMPGMPGGRMGRRGPPGMMMGPPPDLEGEDDDPMGE